ncbi:MAG: hypothetical protein WDN72_04060 [Alphaproteobacteria bacterium]
MVKRPYERLQETDPQRAALVKSQVERLLAREAERNQAAGLERGGSGKAKAPRKAKPSGPPAKKPLMDEIHGREEGGNPYDQVWEDPERAGDEE